MTKHYIFFLALIASISNADDNYNYNYFNYNYIDKAHDMLSKKVVDYSHGIDNTIMNIIDDSEKNTTSAQAKKNTNELSVDTFFHNDKFIDETDETFVSVNLDYNIHSDTTKKFSQSISARLPLSRSTKKYNLFINDITRDNIENVLGKGSNDEKARPEIGINYFTILYRDIQSKYSLGTNGINPFTTARYSLRINYKSWVIEPTQKFKYSLKDEFEEETNIYFDKQLADTRLFRLSLHRDTQTNQSGMDYSLALQHFWTYPNKIGLVLSQSLGGNTEYRYSTNNDLIPGETKKDNGITSYTTALNFRQSIWRKWFYYAVTPSMNFNKQNDYEANYSINFFVQFYFGHLN